MPTLEEHLGAIAEYVGKDKGKARELAIRMDKDGDKEAGLQLVAHVLRQKGANRRTADAETKAQTAEAKMTELQALLEEKTEELENMRSSQPNLKEAIRANDEKWQKKLEERERLLEDEKKGRKTDKLEVHRERFRSFLGFGKPGGVEEEWGNEVLPSRFADRFTLDAEGNLRVLQPGEDTAYDPQEGDPVKQLADDVLGTVPAKYRIVASSANGGGGERGGGGGEPKGRTKEQIAADKRKEYAF